MNCFARFLGIGCVAICVASEAAGADELRVTTDFPGGSARDVQIDQESRTIRIAPGGDAVRGWPCWWFVRVDGTTDGQPIRLIVGRSEEPSPQKGSSFGKPLAGSWAMPDQATWSPDGRTWSHTQRGKTVEGRIEYSVTPTGTTTWIAWGPPFTPSDAEALLDAIAQSHAWAERRTLARTRGDRPVPMLRIAEGELPELQRQAIWIHARQHAWESGSSWVCRGFLEWLVGDEAPACWMRKNCEILVTPIMDVDNAATGNGGKDALPQDHNRDWSDSPHWPEVAAAQRQLKRWADENRLSVFVDLHNPGPNDRKAFFFVGPEELIPESGRRRQQLFLELAGRMMQGAIALDAKPRVSGANYHPLWKQMSKNWVHAHGNDDTLAVCLETSWNTPGSTTEGYRAIGGHLGRTLARLMSGEEKP